MKVRVLGGADGPGALENWINAWLEENPEVEVIDIKLGYAAVARFGAEGWYSAMILYE